GERVTAVAGALIDAGVRPGYRVAIWAPNGPEWLLTALGTLGAGAALVPVSTRFTGPEALDVIGRSRARALFVAGDFLGVDRLGNLLAAAGPGELDRLGLVVRVPEEWDAFLQAGSLAEARRRALTVQPGDVSDIMFTSGTTGRSKGAMTSHERSLGVARARADCARLGPGDRYLVVNPFFHTFGFKAGILACLVSGAALVPQAVFDAGEAMGLAEAERITVLPGAPTIYQMILDHPERAGRDLSSLRLAVTGAADVPVALVERMRRELSFETVLTAYGLTEAVVATMCRPGDPPEVVSATSGRAAAGFEVKIGRSDEILLRGPNLMLGYLDDPEATAAAIDGDGWLHTGDAGRLDEAGYLTITGRLVDMYICGGFNVYPAEVEQVLARLDGAGKHFCAGHDIGTPERDADQSFDREAVLWWDHVGKQGADARYAREMEVYLGMCRRWREIPKPSIAMVHGACIAGGLMLAWVCDLIVAADDAFFADPVVKMGIPGVEYFAHPWVLGPRFAKE